MTVLGCQLFEYELPGTPLFQRCGAQGVVEVTAACRHEHFEVLTLCEWCRGDYVIRGLVMYCDRCSDAGHDCPQKILKTSDPCADPTWQPKEPDTPNAQAGAEPMVSPDAIPTNALVARSNPNNAQEG